MTDFPTHLDSGGTGPAVVFNHGTLMDATMFEPQMAHLAGLGYRVVSQNSRVLLGRTAPHTLEDLADDTAGLAAGLGLGRYVVGGMSVGAFMALDFALKYPDRTAGLILIDGQACDYPAGEQDLFEAEFAKFDVDGPVPRGLAEWAAPFCFGQRTYAENPGLVRHWIDRWSQDIPSRAVWSQSTAWVRKPDITERLKDIAAPVLVVHGADDLPVPVARGLAMAAALRDVTFVKVPDSGHTSNLERPDIVNHAIASFLARVHPR